MTNVLNDRPPTGWPLWRPPRRRCLGHSDIRDSSLFRISRFVLRISARISGPPRAEIKMRFPCHMGAGRADGKRPLTLVGRRCRITGVPARGRTMPAPAGGVTHHSYVISPRPGQSGCDDGFPRARSGISALRPLCLPCCGCQTPTRNCAETAAVPDYNVPTNYGRCVARRPS